MTPLLSPIRRASTWTRISVVSFLGVLSAAAACSSAEDRGPGTGNGAGAGSGTGGVIPAAGGALCVAGNCDIPDGYVPPGCGDGILTEDEVCDDGNTSDGDGCAGSCLGVERGWSCPTPDEPCIPIAICGDGVVSFPEQCDDGDTSDGDGCSSRCKLELGYKCAGQPSVCTPTTCGDSIVEGAEGCDDGNVLPFDGCSPSCQWEPDCPSVGACTPRCGDGVVMPPEQCDDGNLIDGDGCSSSCEEEDGYTCGPLDELGDTMRVPVVLRDFKNSHSDFGGACSGDWQAATTGLVDVTLDADGKPTFAHESSTCNISSQASFSTWFRDGDQAKTFADFLELTSSGGQFAFDAPMFFPVDDRGWVLEPPPDNEATVIADDGYEDGIYADNMPHNYLFTSEVRYWFQYDPEAEAEFFFRGDDDVWVFVGGTLVLDLGGTHIPLTDSFVLNADTESAAGEALELEAGSVYEIAVFHAERNPKVSSYRLELSGFNTSPSDCTPLCGDGIIGLGEECDDGKEGNTGGYGRCGHDCRLTQFCGDGVVQTGEDCDDGPVNGQPGQCPRGCRNVIIR